jgi:hypothetical protein
MSGGRKLWPDQNQSKVASACVSARYLWYVSQNERKLLCPTPLNF